MIEVQFVAGRGVHSQSHMEAAKGITKALSGVFSSNSMMISEISRECKTCQNQLLLVPCGAQMMHSCIVPEVCAAVGL